MELRHLKAFQAVADQLNFRRAAVEVNLTQPALSRQIAKLEADLGRALFTRDRRRVALTAAGAHLYRRCGPLLEEWEAVTREVREAGEGARGVVALGYTEASMSSFLPTVLRRLRLAVPEVVLDLRQDHSEQLAREVARGRLDAAFTSLPAAGEGLRSTLVAEEEVGIVLPEGHRLVRGTGRVALAALKAEGFIFFPYAANPLLHAELVAACRAAGFAPRIVQEADTRILAVNLVASGMGVAFLGVHLAHVCGPGTVFRRLKGPAPRIRFHLVEPSPSAHPVVERLKGMLRKCGETGSG